MATRYAKIEYADVPAFLADWEENISQGNAWLKPEALGGKEAAPNLRVDLVIPGVGRFGPVACQVIFRSPDGGVGLQIPTIPPELHQARDQALAALDVYKDLLLKYELVVEPRALADLRSQNEELQARVDALEAEIVELQKRPVAAPVAAAPVAGAAGVAEGAAPAAAAPAPAAPAAAPAAKRERGFPLPDLSGVPVVAQGALADRSLRDCLVQLAVDRSVGLLTVELPNGQKKYGFWNKGGPVGWRSEPLEQEEVLGVLLFRAGQLTKEQLQESLRVMEENNCRQGEALIDMGLMSFSQLVMVLQKQTELILQKVMRAREGRWRYHAVELPERFVTPPLRVPSLLYRALREYAAKLSSVDLYETLQPHLDEYIRFREETGQVMNEVSWTRGERGFLQILRDRDWRLREVFGVTNLSRLQTASTLWALNEMDFLNFGETESDERYLRRIHERIMNKKYRGQRDHLFDVLEIHWISLPQEIERGYQKLKEEFNADSYRVLTPELRSALVDVNQQLDDAYATIGDKNRRRAYRSELIEDMMILNSAELLGKKGEMAIMRGDGREARTCFGKALELVPGHPTYREGLQRSRGLG